MAAAREEKALALSQFQTRPAIARRLYRDLLPLLPGRGARCVFVEPAAGEGAFYRALPPSRRVGVEVDTSLRRRFPDYVYASEARGGFLALGPEGLGLGGVPSSDIVVVGNPPFSLRRANRMRGRAVNLALRFLNHAATFADTVAFVVGMNFTKRSTQDRVARTHRLVSSTALPDDAFTFRGEPYALRTVFQVWQRGAQPRRPRAASTWIKEGAWQLPGVRPHWEIVVPTDPRANLLVRRWGHVGDVTSAREDVARQRRDSAAAERKYRRDPRYGPRYRLSRNSRSDFFLHARNAPQAARTFRAARPRFAQLSRSGIGGSTASITQEELLRVYLAEARLKPPRGRD